MKSSAILSGGKDAGGSCAFGGQAFLQINVNDKFKNNKKQNKDDELSGSGTNRTANFRQLGSTNANKNGLKPI